MIPLQLVASFSYPIGRTGWGFYGVTEKGLISHSAFPLDTTRKALNTKSKDLAYRMACVTSNALQGKWYKTVEAYYEQEEEKAKSRETNCGC